LKEMLMEGAVAVRRRRKGQARGLRAARLRKSPLGLGQRLIIGNPEPITERVRAGVDIWIVRQG
jgi:hypothetical protein